MHNNVVRKRLRKWNKNIGLAVLKPMNFDFIKDKDGMSHWKEIRNLDANKSGAWMDHMVRLSNSLYWKTEFQMFVLT